MRALATILLTATVPFLLAGCFEEIRVCQPGSVTNPCASDPGAPSNPVVTATAGNQLVTLNWNPVSGAQSYSLYWKIGTGVTIASSQIVGVTSPLLHTGRTNGQQYCYRVTAVNASGESPLSNEECATPQVAPPGTPTSLAASPGDTQVTVSWNAPTSGGTPASYNLYWDTAPGVATASSMISGVTSPYDHLGRTNGQQYCYRVSAVNASGEGSLSNENCAVPQSTATGSPEGVAAIAGDQQIEVGWSPPSSGPAPTSYNLYWSTVSGVTKSTGTPITGISSPYTHMGLTNGTPYYYVVTAVSAGGESTESAEVSAIPEPLPPDLTIPSMTVPSLVTAGSTITASATATNSGGSTAGSFVIGLYLSINATITSSDTWLESCTVSSLSIGSNSICSRSVVIPASTSAGTWYLGAIADNQQAVNEGNENNNTNYRAITIPVDTSVTYHFDTGGFPSVFSRAASPSGAPLWFITTPGSAGSSESTFGVRSGAIGNNQSTCLYLSPSFETSYILFHRKVSTESGFDYLEFYIDGVFQEFWSGERAWSPIVYTHPIASKQYGWCYVKDGSAFGGSDAVWIDNVEIRNF